MFTITLIGRPNVGKSTLFNRLAGKKLAIVHDEPGVTRDRRMAEGALADLTFSLIDTPGIETEHMPKKTDALLKSMWAQTEKAIEEADLLLFVLDSREGITHLDKGFARHIRKQDKPCVLVLNKAESAPTADVLSEIEKIGFSTPVPLSAEHGQGLHLLYEVLQPHYDAYKEKESPSEDIEENPEKPINLAIVGRPNAGKSTLINQIIEEERFLTGPTAGLTRDTQSVSFHQNGQSYLLFDTAGLRKKAKVVHDLEKIMAKEAKRAIQYAEVVCLVLDATMPLEKQDLTIAHHIIEEGRILVIVLNKIDLVEDLNATLKEMRLRLGEELPQVVGLPFVHVSALSGRNVEKVFDAVGAAYTTWNQRITTGKLNQWLDAVQHHHPPPLSKGRRVKIRYMTQIKSRPPTFALFISQPKALPESYLRYLKNRLAKDFSLSGVPLRLLPRGGKNPYAPK
ncbi:MAG: ribosome biogenesis GTPase Der [Holosporaceae bacterium]|nr:MAG: ribosome biogenesis GTPase Der [Holosporaceae bacterium]